MKKLISMILVAVLALGLVACTIDTKPIYVGTWVGEANPEKGIEASILTLSEDGTGLLIIGSEAYNLTWKVRQVPETFASAEEEAAYATFRGNPDALDITAVNGLVANPLDPNFPILKATLNVTKGEIFLNISDGNAKDDDFSIAVLVKKISDAEAAKLDVPAYEIVDILPTEAATEPTEAATEATEAATEATESTEAATETTEAATETTAAAN